MEEDDGIQWAQPVEDDRPDRNRYKPFDNPIGEKNSRTSAIIVGVIVSLVGTGMVASLLIQHNWDALVRLLETHIR